VVEGQELGDVTEDRESHIGGEGGEVACATAHKQYDQQKQTVAKVAVRRCEQKR